MVTRFKVERNPPPGRNAPNTHSAFSGCVDALTAAAEEARDIGLHAVADKFFRMRDEVAADALDLWGRGKGGAR